MLMVELSFKAAYCKLNSSLILHFLWVGQAQCVFDCLVPSSYAVCVILNCVEQQRFEALDLHANFKHVIQCLAVCQCASCGIVCDISGKAACLG